MSGQPEQRSACGHTTRAPDDGPSCSRLLWLVGVSTVSDVGGSEKPTEPPLLGGGVVIAQEGEVVSVDDGMRRDGPPKRSGERKDSAQQKADDAGPRDPDPAAGPLHLMR